ncbi:MAG: hypothetical protein OEV87_11045 [Phycisphaerae bacterium]|nr:hypothetical protein [Phycisphaerae bacterium]
MGRWYYDSKTTVEQATQLSIFKLKEFGLLRGHCGSTLTWTRRLSGHETSIGIWVDIHQLYAKVNYTNTNGYTGEKTDLDYKIPLTTTPCHLGGVRYWFICPLTVDGVYCGRRVGTLYLASGKYFGCRHCHNLSYESRNESRLGRFGQMGYFLVLDRKLEERYKKLKRRYYAGKPTRKYKQILKLERQLDSIHIPKMEELLFYGKKR